jgi:hypothetical protein
VTLAIAFTSGFIIVSPLFFGISFFCLLTTILVKQRIFFVEVTKRIYSWLDLIKILRIIAAIATISIGYYVLYLLGYYDDPFFEIIVNLVKKINFLYFILAVSMIFFMAGFSAESYIFWGKNDKKLKPILSILFATSSFISLFCSKRVITYLTGVEASIFSTSSVIFAIFIGILLWFFLIVAILAIIYMSTVFVGGIIPSLYFVSFFIIQNTSARSKIKQKFVNFFLVVLGRAFGAVSLALLIFSIGYISLALSSIYKEPLIHGVETAIVYLDYRPQSKVTECTNLESEEWGLYQVKMNSHHYNREDKSIVSPYAQASNDCPASE